MWDRVPWKEDVMWFFSQWMKHFLFTCTPPNIYDLTLRLSGSQLSLTFNLSKNLCENTWLSQPMKWVFMTFLHLQLVSIELWPVTYLLRQHIDLGYGCWQWSWCWGHYILQLWRLTSRNDYRHWKWNLATRVQTLDEAMYASFCTNAFGERLESIPQLIEFFSFGLATTLREEKLNLNSP